MDDVIVAAPPLSVQEHLLLRRRTALSACSLSLPSYHSDDLELLTIKPSSHSYTSIKDLIPANAVNSPRPNTPIPAQPFADINIRNRLVQQAAWAYLQPTMSTLSGSDSDSLFQRVWGRVRELVGRVFGWALRVVGIGIGR